MRPTSFKRLHPLSQLTRPYPLPVHFNNDNNIFFYQDNDNNMMMMMISLFLFFLFMNSYRFSPMKFRFHINQYFNKYNFKKSFINEK